MGKKIPLWQAYMCFFFTLIVLMYCLGILGMVFGDKFACDYGEVHIALIVSAIFASIVAACNGYKWAFLEAGILASMGCCRRCSRNDLLRSSYSETEHLSDRNLRPLRNRRSGYRFFLDHSRNHRNRSDRCCYRSGNSGSVSSRRYHHRSLLRRQDVPAV